MTYLTHYLKQMNVMALTIALLITSPTVLTTETKIANQSSTQRAQTVTDSSLYKQPKHMSAVVSELEKNESVMIFERQRAWYRVATNNELAGWLKMLNVRFIESAKREDDLGVKSLFDTVVKQQVTPTTSTGVRGFDEEGLKKAKADLAQLEQLESYIQTPEQSIAFANAAGLKANTSIEEEEK